MGDDPGHDFKGHEADDQRERNGQVASIGFDTEAMRMIGTVVVTLVSGVVVRFLRRHHNLDLIVPACFSACLLMVSRGWFDAGSAMGATPY